MTRTLALPILSIAAFLLAQTASAAAEPLPTQRDIPAEESTVICPDEAAGRRLFEDYYTATAAGGFDIYRFFDGLKATGCEQKSGPLQIVEILGRRLIGTSGGTQLLYRASRPDGAVVFGLIDEGVNDQFPRTDFARWMQLHAPGGRLIDRQGNRLYLCPSPADAQKLVHAILPMGEPGTADPQQIKSRDRAFAAARCRIASGEYRITAVGDSQFVSLGPEAGEDWTALVATDSDGREVGLVYDASVM